MRLPRNVRYYSIELRQGANLSVVERRFQQFLQLGKELSKIYPLHFFPQPPEFETDPRLRQILLEIYLWKLLSNPKLQGENRHYLPAVIAEFLNPNIKVVLRLLPVQRIPDDRQNERNGLSQNEAEQRFLEQLSHWKKT